MMFYEDDDDVGIVRLLQPQFANRQLAQLCLQNLMSSKDKPTTSTKKPKKKRPDAIVIKVGPSMGRFFNNKELSDVKLKVGDKVFEAHKIVLVSASDVFEAMLMKGNWPEASQQEVELQDDDSDTFALVLKFLYTGKICLHIEIIMSVYQVADKYNMKVLKMVLCKFLHKFVTQREQQGKLTSPEAIALCNAFEADTQMHPGLRCVIQWIGNNFTSFIKSCEWETLPRRTILMILQKDEIGDNEQKIFAAAKRWLEFDSSRTETPELIYEVLQHVRLTFLSARELYAIENDPIVLKSPQMMKLVSDTIRRKFYESVPDFIGESVKPKWLKRRDRSYIKTSYNRDQFDEDYYFGYDDYEDDDDCYDSDLY